MKCPLCKSPLRHCPNPHHGRGPMYHCTANEQHTFPAADIERGSDR